MNVLGAKLDAEVRAEMDAEIEKRIEDAVAFAESSDFPGIEELHHHVFA